MELKRTRLLVLNNALSRLDSTTKDDDKGSASYKFSAKVIFALYRNLCKTRDYVEEIEKTRLAVVKKYLEAGQQSVSDKNIPKFTEEWTLFLEGKDKFSLERVRLSELALERNPIPLNVLADLSCILIDDTIDKGKNESDENESDNEESK